MANIHNAKQSRPGNIMKHYENQKHAVEWGYSAKKHKGRQNGRFIPLIDMKKY